MDCELKTMMINGEEYVKKSDVQPIDEATEPLRIIMNIDRGLCLVGNVDLSGNGPDDLLTIKNARCIIRWGTSKHLAELAALGPLENTCLGFCYTHQIPRRSIALVLDCNVRNWS